MRNSSIHLLQPPLSNSFITDFEELPVYYVPIYIYMYIFLDVTMFSQKILPLINGDTLKKLNVYAFVRISLMLIVEK